MFDTFGSINYTCDVMTNSTCLLHAPGRPRAPPYLRYHCPVTGQYVPRQQMFLEWLQSVVCVNRMATGRCSHGACPSGTSIGWLYSSPYESSLAKVHCLSWLLLVCTNRVQWEHDRECQDTPGTFHARRLSRYARNTLYVPPWPSPCTLRTRKNCPWWTWPAALQLWRGAGPG